ncbi:metalloregulator ArsR/SmtB family transcription factor [Ornithinibacillus californiensis]|uniref:metalloregulator ArsR/SmtB family transcription factor n=1 Tax=Ornithinibacillus californiensis TaxID=161536 RepID=UPI00064D907A|nr:metalloregulator ArsR/SmtB family transcription factor [Ornithinibacillus californiensis]
MSDIYRALGDATRRRIITMLKERSMTQKEIVEAFDISQPAIKKHLNVLLEEKIISATVQGKYRLYNLNLDMLQRAYNEMLHFIGELLDDQLASLKNYVEKGEMQDGES